MSQNQIERMYQYLHRATDAFVEDLDCTYSEALLKSVSQLVELKVPDDVSLSTKESLSIYLSELGELNWNPEDVRKAMQLILLRVLGEEAMPKTEMTPDTIAFFIAFFINQLYSNEAIIMMDPLAGTGNLLATLHHHAPSIKQSIAVEQDEVMMNLLQATVQCLNLPCELYFQDTLTYHGPKVDTMVVDFPYVEMKEEEYFPYQVLLHHHQQLRDGGFVFSVIFDDFFDHTQSQSFRVLIQEHYDVVGLLKLPSNLFKRYTKSIFILRKKQEGIRPIKKALALELPDFEDYDAMAEMITFIRSWIDKNIIKGDQSI